MPAPQKYPEELRERAIRLTLDARKDPDPAAVDGGLGVTRSSSP